MRRLSAQFIKTTLTLVVLLCVTVLAQDSQNPTTTAPPPLKILAPEDRTTLEQTKDTKARVKRTIELADARLLKAETHTTKDQFTEASTELGKYWALMEDVFRLLAPLNRDSTKTRDMYKRVEIALRGHGTKLTLIRRTTPIEYGVWIKQLEEYARNGRTEALNSFYGHTVVRENPAKVRNEQSSEKRAIDNSAPPEKQL